ncbi:unnamed protein product [Rotaria magnacalcarata]|uniref:V-SNARE coiled-coil homology domain-containing protein n=1 Tax=Rotaria magnacalcarata TaxID=392030 RepID=A0A816LBN2_9BILA|nr:unnamed protein product [Rotaria magnacalcarata]CAF1411808.1 unnamed protein product [Rotaria magnacalcarata]CAF1933846.1 unnamed protein product [Rotaria magnacalcarata]CAF2055568.1 unnamed protein product [Rotaria magnacalcarata]CAF2078225.1 unnamed protein product [Rotaria magnacalcarata]
MITTNHKQISYNKNSKSLSTKGETSQLEINKLYDLANQTEHELRKAIDSNMARNEQLNVLLDRSDLLLHKNQAFGYGVMDYRKDIERKQSINKIKYIAIGILLLIVVVLVVILNIILNQTNHLSDRSTNIVLE